MNLSTTDSKPFRPRILKALSLEKRLSGKQLARLMYPTEFTTDPKKTYHRVMKNLEKMESEDLLTSKAYRITDEKLWLIKKSKIARDLGYEPTFPPHALLLDHEKAHGDVFVSLMLSGRLTGWDRSERPHLRDDGQFFIDEDLYYLEVEMENHGQDRLAEKVARYKKHFRESQEPFHVLFVMKQSLGKILKVFESEHTTTHYKACLLDEVVASPLSAPLHHVGGQKCF